MSDGSERRLFRRAAVPLTWAPARGLWARRNVENVSSGGVRVRADEALVKGHRLDLELFPPEGPTIKVLAEVVWIDALPPRSGALYDVGMRFVHIDERDKDRLERFLEAAGGDG